MLERIERRLAALERQGAWLDTLRDALPGLTAAAGDTLDEAAQAFELHARVPAVLALLERLSRPQTLQALQRAVDLAESLPSLVATAGDTVDDLAAAATRAGLPPHATLTSLLARGQTLLLALQQAEPPASGPGGLFGMLRALRDPEVQRTLGYVLELSRAFGRVAGSADSPPALPRGLSPRKGA